MLKTVEIQKLGVEILKPFVNAEQEEVIESLGLNLGGLQEGIDDQEELEKIAPFS